MEQDKLTLDVEKIKEVHELKEGCKYIIQVKNASREEMWTLRVALKSVLNIQSIIIDEPIKIYEVKE